jgi:hypothetical protein
MEHKKILHLMASAGGILAWLLFILACTPAAWSPDSNKILFSYIDPDSETAGIAMYERASGSVVPVFHSHLRRLFDPLPLAQWTGDGKQAIVFLEWDDTEIPGQVLLIPLGSKGAVRHFLLPKIKEAISTPFPQIGDELFLGTNVINRLNLKTGEIKTRDLDEGESIALQPAGDFIWYALSNIVRADRKDHGVQFGEMNPADLSLKPLFEFWDSDKERLGITELSIGPLGSGDSRLAGSAWTKDGSVILLFNRSGLERVVTPSLPDKKCLLGAVVGAADLKSVYAPMLCPSDNQLSIAEIPLEGGPVTLTRIAHLTMETSSLTSIGFYASLAPDKHSLAISLAYMDKNDIATEDRALYLIDLKDPHRTVTKHVVPPDPALEAKE